MKTKQIVQYIFNARERNAINEYINFLTRNPLPCTTCPAQQAGKCAGYDIFSQELNDDETCTPTIKYFNDRKHEAYRSYFKNLKDEEVKKFILNLYYLELAKKKNADTNAEVLVAQHIVDVDRQRIEFELPYLCKEDSPMFELEGESE